MRTLLAVLSISLIAPPAADACVNGTIPFKVHDIKELKHAEQLVAQRKYRGALRYLRKSGSKRRARYRSRTRMRSSMGGTLWDRRQAIYATIAIRTAGRHDIKGKCCSKAKRSTERNLTAAARILGLKTDAASIKDPMKAGLVGEALSRIPQKREQALGLLESLATRDLITSPEAWLALARVRMTQAGIDQAIARCVQMAPKAKLCRLKPVAKVRARPRKVIPKGVPIM